MNVRLTRSPSCAAIGPLKRLSKSSTSLSSVGSPSRGGMPPLRLLESRYRPVTHPSASVVTPRQSRSGDSASLLARLGPFVPR